MKLVAVMLAVSLSFVGCQEDGTDDPLPARPVLWTTAIPQAEKDIRLVGTVEPKVQTNHAFRVLGRLTLTDASVGDIVTKGQTLAALDPATFELAVRSAQAAVSNAEAQLSSVTTEKNRQTTLLETNATTEAVYDIVAQQLEAARAGLTRAKAALSKAEEQLGYTRITAEHDGVVIGTFAEVGETVAPGKTIITIANADVREAVVDLPDTICDCVPIGTNATVSLELDPSIKANGIVREIAPVADSLSRTVRARVTLKNPPQGFRLGTTVIVNFASQNAPVMAVPNTAILKQDGNAYVWVITDDDTSIFKQLVSLGEDRGILIEILDGLEPGTRIVVAGVNSLEASQPIRLGEELTF
jgi:RND family efflux transporter MFP subunit